MSKRKFVLTMAVLLLPIGAFASTLETAKVRTARGSLVDVALDIPPNLEAKAPAVVIAPGQGYHMDLPILRSLAEKLAAQGSIVARFNWNYFSTDSKHGRPSSDLSAEEEDMKAVLSFVRADARVDLRQIVLAGKSLGSVVSYRVFTQDSSAAALALLTPVCTSSFDEGGQPLPVPAPSGPKNYPGIASALKPIAMLPGNADPLCSLPMLYDFLKETKGNVTVHVVSGDHSWNVSSGSDLDSVRRNEESVGQGVATTASWINFLLGR